MKKFLIKDFNKGNIEEIKQSGRKWSLYASDYDEFLVALAELVRKFDLSEIITNVDYPNKISVFNAVGTKANYAQLVKWAENAIRDEQQGKNVNDQWKAIISILEEAQVQGEDYCSLIRGWEGSAHNGKGAAQGDQILKLLAENLQTTKNHEIKSAIFELILEEANKGDNGLYAIPNNYKNNQNVKYAAAKHQEFVNSDELLVLGIRWNSIEPEQEEENHIPSSFENYFNPPTGMEDGVDFNNPEHVNTLLSTAEQLADHSLAQNPNNTVGALSNLFSFFVGTSSSTTNQPTPGSSNNRSSQIDIKQEIKKANELLKEYNKSLEESGFDKEVVKTILETKDEDIINEAIPSELNNVRKKLEEKVQEVTKELPKYYKNLSSIEKSFFKGKEVCSGYNELAKNIRSVDISLSDDLRYPLVKIIREKAPKNLFEMIEALVGGESERDYTITLENFMQEYENNHPEMLGRE